VLRCCLCSVVLLVHEPAAKTAEIDKRRILCCLCQRKHPCQSAGTVMLADWNGIGMEWNGMEWNRNGMEWNGMEGQQLR
jgi:hypothetical protein